MKHLCRLCLLVVGVALASDVALAQGRGEAPCATQDRTALANAPCVVSIDMASSGGRPALILASIHAAIRNTSGSQNPILRRHRI